MSRTHAPTPGKFDCTVKCVLGVPCSYVNAAPVTRNCSSGGGLWVLGLDMMSLAFSIRVLAPHRGQEYRAYLSQGRSHNSLYPVVRLAFSLLVSTVKVFDHTSASSRMCPALRCRYRGGVIGVVVLWTDQNSYARRRWLANASHLPNIPYLPCLLMSWCPVCGWRRPHVRHLVAYAAE